MSSHSQGNSVLPAARKAVVRSRIHQCRRSLGQFVFAPAVQFVIGAAGWANAMFATASAALLTIPLVLPLRRDAAGGASPAMSSPPTQRQLTLREQLRDALRNPSYLHLHAGFFTSSPAVFTWRSWSRICQAICSCAA